MKTFTLSLLTSFLSLFISPANAQNNVLSFDGVDDLIIVPPVSQYDFEYGTFEVWVKPEGLTGNACILANRSYGGTRYSFHMSTTVIGLFDGYGFGTVPFISTPGIWYHLAFVCDPYNTKIYVNGNFIGDTGNGIMGWEYNWYENPGVTGQEVSIGSVRDGGGEYEHFKGEIDDVRLWDYCRGELQINADKNATLIGNEPGLVALFSFDQGIAGGSNQSITQVAESVSLNDGFMVNFSMTGITSNFVSRNSTLPVTLSDFRAIKQNNAASLQWFTNMEQNSQSFIIERSADGKNFTAIGSVRAAGNSNSRKAYSYDDAAPLKGNNYYRLKQVDLDGKSAYSEIRTLNFATASKLTWYTQGNNAVVQLPGGKNEQYAVTDMNGATTMQGRLENGKMIFAGKPAGVYNVRVWTETGVSSIKIILQ